MLMGHSQTKSPPGTPITRWPLQRASSGAESNLRALSPAKFPSYPIRRYPPRLGVPPKRWPSGILIALLDEREWGPPDFDSYFAVGSGPTSHSEHSNPVVSPIAEL